jgi:hypothetical protein
MAPNNVLKHAPSIDESRGVPPSPRGSLLRRGAMWGLRVPCECRDDLTHTDRENPFVQEGCATCGGRLSVLVWAEMMPEWEGQL